MKTENADIRVDNYPKQGEYFIIEVDKLVPYANNARTHSKAQIDQIAASIRAFGYMTPITIDENNTILSGHGRYYGLRSRFILSYDMTFLSIVLDLDKQVDLEERLLCYRRHAFTEEENWKRVAAMSVLLASKKLEDDINDENELKAKVGLRIFQRAAKKAETDYPAVADLFKRGFSEMSRMEKDGRDVFALSEKFSEIMTDAVTHLFSCSAADVAVMRHVTQWVYFIDALDDLDEDSRDGSYNPFKALATTKKELLSNNMEYLEQFISGQMTELKPFLPSFAEGTPKNMVIMNTLLETLPTVTERVMKGEKTCRRTSVMALFLQSRGGYKLA